VVTCAGADTMHDLADAWAREFRRFHPDASIRIRRDGKFAAGTDVQAQTFLRDPTGDRDAEESLAGVVHVDARECGRVGAGPAPQVVLVQQ